MSLQDRIQASRNLLQSRKQELVSVQQEQEQKQEIVEKNCGFDIEKEMERLNFILSNFDQFKSLIKKFETKLKPKKVRKK